MIPPFGANGNLPHGLTKDEKKGRFPIRGGAVAHCSPNGCYFPRLLTSNNPPSGLQKS